MPRKGPDVGIQWRQDAAGNWSCRAHFQHQGERQWSDPYPSRTPGEKDPLAESAARQWRQKQMHEAACGRLGIPKKVTPITFEEAVSGFLEWGVNEKRWQLGELGGNYRFYSERLCENANEKKGIWLAAFAGRILSSITTEEIEEVLAGALRDGRRRRTIQAHRQAISALMVWASSRRRGHLAVNPVKAIELELPKARSKRGRREPRWLRMHEAQLFERKLPDRHRLLFRTLLRTGMRQAEIFRAPWSGLDLDQGLLYFMGKTNPDDVVPLPRVIVDEFRAELAAGRPHTYHGEFIFSDDGLPVNVRKTIASTCKAAGVSPRGLGLHAFRHTFSTLIYTISQHNARLVAKARRDSVEGKESAWLYVHSDRDIDLRPVLEELSDQLDGALAATPIAAVG